METEPKIIREIKTSNWGVRIVRKDSEIYLQYTTPLASYEAKLYDIIKLIDTYCRPDETDCGTWYRWHDDNVKTVPPIFEKVIRVMKYLPIGEVPGMYVGELQQIYGLCFRKRFYRVYVLWGGIWGDYRLWIIVAPPINNEAAETWCAYCHSDFC